MSRMPVGRLLIVFVSFVFCLWASAPTLGWSGLFKYFMSREGFARYEKQKITFGLDLEGGMDVVYQVDSKKDEEIRSAVEILRNRIDLFGVTNATVQIQAENQIRVQIPGADPVKQQKIKQVIDTTDLLTLHKVIQETDNVLALAPEDDQTVMQESVARDKTGKAVKEPSWFLLVKEPEVKGDALQNAFIGFDPLTGSPKINLEFNGPGTKLFAEVSKRMVGERLAIVLAGKVYMAPVMKSEIPDGRAEITGSFDIEEARTVTSILKAGALPAGLKKLSENTVGPTLGADSVARGAAASKWAAGLVLVYLAWYYKLAGLYACFGQFMNFLILLAGLIFFDAALTLPGIAGIALGIGMSMDANVIVFERIKEEFQAGKSIRLSIENGFDKAYSAVFDGNLTTLLTSLVLFIFGSGPVKGFAVTLSIGLLASMYSALFVVRALLDATYAGKKSGSISI